MQFDENLIQHTNTRIAEVAKRVWKMHCGTFAVKIMLWCCRCWKAALYINKLIKITNNCYYRKAGIKKTQPDLNGVKQKQLVRNDIYDYLILNTCCVEWVHLGGSCGVVVVVFGFAEWRGAKLWPERGLTTNYKSLEDIYSNRK